MALKPPSDIMKTIQVLDSSIRRLQEERRRLIALLPEEKPKKFKPRKSMKEKYGKLIQMT